MKTKMVYRIAQEGKSHGIWSDTFTSFEKAKAALRRAKGWRAAYTSSMFESYLASFEREGDAEGDNCIAVACYETRAEEQADQDGGGHAVWICWREVER